MSDLPAAAITAAHDAFWKARAAYDQANAPFTSGAAWAENVIREVLEAAAPHITAAATAAERERIREHVAVLNAWLEHLPQRHVPLRAAEALLRLRNLTAPDAGEDAP